MDEELLDKIKELTKISEGDPYEKLMEIPEIIFQLKEMRNNSMKKLASVEGKLKFKTATLYLDIQDNPAKYGIPPKKLTIKDSEMALDRTVVIAAMKENVVNEQYELDCLDGLLSTVYASKEILMKMTGSQEFLGYTEKIISMADRRKAREAEKQK